MTVLGWVSEEGTPGQAPKFARIGGQSRRNLHFQWIRFRFEVAVVEILAAGLATFAFDYGSKKLVKSRFPRRVFAVAPGLTLRLARNRRPLYRRPVTHSLLAVLWLAAVASTLTLHLTGTRFQSASALAGIGIALGGAAGNLVEIVTRHSVTDFIDFRWWPAFNIADIAIVAGLTLALWPRG